jgi:hypothetical protein
MLRKFFPLQAILLSFIICPGDSSGQLLATDSNYLTSSLQYAVQNFQSSLKGNTHLFNGWQNNGYERGAKGHPYFIADSMQLGNVLYDGVLYKNIPLLYDENNDNLITLQYYTPGLFPATNSDQKKLRMDMVKEKISWFTIPGHEFIKIDSTVAGINMPAGFYERVYNGNIKMYVKRSKQYAEAVKQKDLEIWYDIFDEYYVFNDGKIYHIKSKKSLIEAFTNKSKQVSSFIKGLNMQYRKNREQVIYETTRYYDTHDTHL